MIPRQGKEAMSCFVQDCQSTGSSSVLEGIPFEVFDESCDTCSSIVCVGTKSRYSVLDHFNLIYEFLLVGVLNSI